MVWKYTVSFFEKEFKIRHTPQKKRQKKKRTYLEITETYKR